MVPGKKNNGSKFQSQLITYYYGAFIFMVKAKESIKYPVNWKKAEVYIMYSTTFPKLNDH